MDELRAKLAKLHTVAPRLNATTNEVSSVVQAVERFLDGLSLEVSAKSSHFDKTRLGVSRKEDDTMATDSPWVFARLAYGPVGGRHQIYILKTTERTTDGQGWEAIATEEIPWSSSSNEIKLASFGKMSELLDEIADRCNHLLEQAATTTSAGKEVLNAIGAERTDQATEKSTGRNSAPDLVSRRRQTSPLFLVEDDCDKKVYFVSTKPVGVVCRDVTLEGPDGLRVGQAGNKRPVTPLLCVDATDDRCFKVFMDRSSWERDESGRKRFKPYHISKYEVYDVMPEGLAKQLWRSTQ